MNSDELDGAMIIRKTSNRPENNFGVVSGKGVETEITALAICRYSDSPNQFYVFACDGRWKVIGDLVFGSLAEAMKEAERYYCDGTPIAWE